MEISDASVMVVGGSSGLGAACASRLSTLNANVLIADLNAPLQSDDSIGYTDMDVTNQASVTAAIESAVQQFGSLRAVVVCAGIIHGERIVGREGPFDLDAFRRVIEVNLIGTFNVLRLAAAAMENNSPDDDGERGVIVMTSSIAAFEGQVGQAAYSASKGGVAAMTLPAARELARCGIRVITIAPGVFETPMMQHVSERYSESLQSQTVFPTRLGKPDEFAQLVVQILENKMLNGTVIRLDGSMRMSGK